MGQIVWKLKTYMALYLPIHSGIAISAFFLCYIRIQNNYVQMHFIHVILKRNVWCIICFVLSGNSAVEPKLFDAKIHGRFILYATTFAMLRRFLPFVFTGEHHPPWTAIWKLAIILARNFIFCPYCRKLWYRKPTGTLW